MSLEDDLKRRRWGLGMIGGGALLVVSVIGLYSVPIAIGVAAVILLIAGAAVLNPQK